YVGMAPLDKALRRACAAGAVATMSREAQIPGRSAAEVEALLSHAV
ncbi:MAG: hypothetical protein QOI90_1000, partial [Mycobacterium sp.]|nr:hypothetical protein [Mycobacterium sp.]